MNAVDCRKAEGPKRKQAPNTNAEGKHKQIKQSLLSFKYLYRHSDASDRGDWKKLWKEHSHSFLIFQLIGREGYGIVVTVMMVAAGKTVKEIRIPKSFVSVTCALPWTCASTSRLPTKFHILVPGSLPQKHGFRITPQ
jgi:hypothetical protein